MLRKLSVSAVSALLLMACGSQESEVTGSGGTLGSGGLTGSGGTGSGSGGLGGGMSGSGGQGGGVCSDTCPTSSTGFVEIDCQKRFMYGVNYAWGSFGNDFGGYVTWNQKGVAADRATRKAEMQQMKDSGVDVIRWWMFPNFDRTDGITWDANNLPTGLGGTAVADINAALDIAAEVGVHIQLTLFSFDSFKKDNTRKLGDYLAAATKRAAIIDKIVKPVASTVAASANKDRMISWDVINEPEWAITGNDGYGDQDFSPDSNCAAVSFTEMETFVKEVITALHATSTAPVTVGCAAIKWAKAWSKVGVDHYNFHMYGWVNDYFPHDRALSQYGVTDKQVVMGEFPISGLPASTIRGTAAVSYSALLGKLWEIGYAGAMGWAFTEKEVAFSWSDNKAAVKAFADSKTCMVRY